MIEIVSRWDKSKVLYCAENAQDVRAAVEEAVREGADLRGADLRGADLWGADLRGADLWEADLRGADLWEADLRGADLWEADSHRSPLWPVKLDIWSILDQAPAEVPALRTALMEGKVNGSVYEGACACLVGTIANARGCAPSELRIPQDGSRPAEQWFLPINEGDHPVEEPEREGQFRAKIAVEWIDEWTESRTAIARVLQPTTEEESNVS